MPFLRFLEYPYPCAQLYSLSSSIGHPLQQIDLVRIHHTARKQNLARIDRNYKWYTRSIQGQGRTSLGRRLGSQMNFDCLLEGYPLRNPAGTVRIVQHPQPPRIYPPYSWYIQLRGY